MGPRRGRDGYRHGWSGGALPCKNGWSLELGCWRDLDGDRGRDCLRDDRRLAAGSVAWRGKSGPVGQSVALRIDNHTLAGFWCGTGRELCWRNSHARRICVDWRGRSNVAGAASRRGQLGLPRFLPRRNLGVGDATGLKGSDRLADILSLDMRGSSGKLALRELPAFGHRPGDERTARVYREGTLEGAAPSQSGNDGAQA